MSLLQIQNLSKSYGDFDLLKQITFNVSFGDRIGIVGSNGCGKSTLLKLLAKQETKDGGILEMQSGLPVHMLAQDGLTDLQLRDLAGRALTADEKKYCKRLRISQLSAASPATLSGGERTRLSLALILAQDPGLLLLDEPTNNLDYQGSHELLSLLKNYPGTIITVSHDRYFLDSLVTQIIEIEHGKSHLYYGSYTEYREEKERLFHERMHRYQEHKKQQQNIEESIQEIKGWSKKAHQNSTKRDSSGLKFGVKEKKRAKARKMDKRVKSSMKRLEKLKTTSETKPMAENKVRFEIQKTHSGGRYLLQADRIAKSFGEHLLFENSDFAISRGEKIAIFGPNGCGKSTLIQIIMGKEPLTSGSLWISPSAEPYLLPQNFEELSDERSTLQYLTDIAGPLTGLDRSILNNLGITAAHLTRPVAALSYGERMKLKLVMPILKQQSFIILDEPTNHLDLPAREMLENTLAEYPGTLLIVSHDLYFLRKLCNKVLLFENNKIQKLEYSFCEYMKMELV